MVNPDAKSRGNHNIIPTRRVLLISIFSLGVFEVFLSGLVTQGYDWNADNIDNAPTNANANTTRIHQWTQKAQFYFGENAITNATTTKNSTTDSIPNGSYHFPASAPASEALSSAKKDYASYFNFRPVIYMTTHASEAHVWYLDACWPLAMRHSQLLSHADIMVYLTYPDDVQNPHSEQSRRRVIQILRHRFQHQTLTIHVRDNPGYEEGALAAMKDAMSGGWFAGYDWVVRLNPDVIVRNETFMLQTMQNDPNATGILINCDSRKPLAAIHTDFFAIKPGVLPMGAFLNVSTGGGATVEGHFAHDIRKAIIDRGNHRWVPGSEPTWHTCRAGFGRDMGTADVVHHHLGADLSRPWARMPEPDRKSMRCPVPFG